MHIFPLQKAFGRDPEESDVDEVIVPTSDTESEPEETCTEVAPEEENADDANTTQMTEHIDAHSFLIQLQYQLSSPLLLSQILIWLSATTVHWKGIWKSTHSKKLQNTQRSLPFKLPCIPCLKT